MNNLLLESPFSYQQWAKVKSSKGDGGVGQTKKNFILTEFQHGSICYSFRVQFYVISLDTKAVLKVSSAVCWYPALAERAFPVSRRSLHPCFVIACGTLQQIGLLK